MSDHSMHIMTLDLLLAVLRKELPAEDAVYIWFDGWEYRLKRLICRIRGHVPRRYGDGYNEPYEKWCDRCQANHWLKQEQEE